LLRHGEIENADSLISEALSVYEHLDDPYGHANVLQLQADIAFAHGDLPLTACLLEAALSKSSAIKDDRSTINLVVDLARLARATGQAQRAARLLAAATVKQESTGLIRLWNPEQVEREVAMLRAALGDAAFETAWSSGRAITWSDAVADAMAVLASRSVAPLVRIDAGPRLTRREREVLRLLGERLTDPEIAARLYLSSRTVESHVANILAKLNVQNRRQAIAVAVKRGLI
jgi:DNA-binding CsgD family transcriptional regulator